MYQSEDTFGHLLVHWGSCGLVLSSLGVDDVTEEDAVEDTDNKKDLEDKLLDNQIQFDGLVHVSIGLVPGVGMAGNMDEMMK